MEKDLDTETSSGTSSETVRHTAPAAYYATDTERFVFRASALGSCRRALWASISGMEALDAPDFMKTAYEEGHAAEPKILKIVEDEFGGSIRYRQTVIEVPIMDIAVVRGHPDGKFMGELIDVTQPVVDAKFLGDSLYDKWDRTWDDPEAWCAAFPYYAWQMSAYMVGSKSPGAFLVGRKIREDGDETRERTRVGEVEVFTVTEPFYSKVKLIKRVKELIELAQGEMPTCDIDQYPCPYYFIHDEPEVVVSDDRLMGMMAAQLNTANEMEKQAKELKDKAREYLNEVLDRQGWRGEKVQCHGEDGTVWEVNDIVQKRRFVSKEKVEGLGKRFGFEMDDAMVESETRYQRVKKV